MTSACVRVVIASEERAARVEGLAAEAKGAQLLQVVKLAQLRRRGTQGHAVQIDRRNTLAVVGHLEQLDAVLPQADVEARGAGVERILKQLLECRRQVHNHLVRADAVSYTHLTLPTKRIV